MVVKGMNLLMNFSPWACFLVFYTRFQLNDEPNLLMGKWLEITIFRSTLNSFFEVIFIGINMLQSINSWGKSRQQTSENGIWNLLSTFHRCWASGFSAGFETIDDAEAAQAGLKGRCVGDFWCNLVRTGWCRRRGGVKSILGEKTNKTHEKWGKLRMIDPAKGCRRMIALNIYVDTFDHMILLSWKATPASAHQTIVFILFILVKVLCVVYHFWPPGREVYEISINRAPVKPAAVPYYLFQLVLGKKLRSWVGT